MHRLIVLRRFPGKVLGLVLIPAVLLVMAFGCTSDTSAPVATADPTDVPTEEPSPATTPIPTPAPEPTAVPIPTPDPTPTATPVPSPTAKPTATQSPLPTPTPTVTLVPSPTPRPTPIPNTPPLSQTPATRATIRASRSQPLVSWLPTLRIVQR